MTDIMVFYSAETHTGHFYVAFMKLFLVCVNFGAYSAVPDSLNYTFYFTFTF